MMKKPWFTFIEIIVVVTIIALTSTSWFFYFANYLGQKKLENTIEQLSLEIDDFNYQVARREIHNFTLDFGTGFGYSLSYNDSSNTGAIFSSLDFGSGSFVLGNTSSSGSTWSIKVFKDEKIYDTLLISSDTSPTLSMFDGREYLLTSYFDGTLTNTLWIRYFSPDNLLTEEDNKVELVAINSASDGTGTGYSMVQYENVSGNKKITASWITLENVYLFLSQGGFEATLTLKK